ncbi:MAG TPA: A24 family peptidase, partial [Thermoanaerobaculia bacterium]|nr:A24 family peptidase [Thermoanaerobaculia bacterium]
MAALHLNLASDLFLAPALLESAAGAALGAGLLLAIGLTYKLLRKVEGMGLGDVKMMAMIGAVVGLGGVLPVLLVASISGAIIGVGIAMRHEKRMMVALPFGVFLGLAFLVVIFFGEPLYEWYLALLFR